jgi:predicted nucleic-acid-binding protein
VTGLDTNVVLPYILGDDPLQSPKSRRIMAGFTAANPGWIALATVLEIVWVLKRKIGVPRYSIADALDRLLAQDSIVIEQADVVAAAAQLYRSLRADFADCLVAESAKAAGCTRTLTFDQIAARDLQMELID